MCRNASGFEKNFTKAEQIRNSYFFVTEAQKSAYLCDLRTSAILITTGKARKLDRFAAYAILGW